VSLLSIVVSLEFPEFLENTVVPERKFPEKASPLEAGRGKYSPPANPERVTSEGLKRRDKGVHVSKQRYFINSTGDKNIASKSQETSVVSNPAAKVFL
jgi:hypothetical protein